MEIIINITPEDFEEIVNTVMTVDEMDNTLKGRIYCAIVHNKVNEQVDKG